MTPEEAIEILKHEHDYAQLLSYVNEAIKMAISAIEKQIPKNVVDKTIEYDGEYGYCPNCNCVIGEMENYYNCKYCGQKLNWKKG